MIGVFIRLFLRCKRVPGSLSGRRVFKPYMCEHVLDLISRPIDTAKLVTNLKGCELSTRLRQTSLSACQHPGIQTRAATEFQSKSRRVFPISTNLRGLCLPPPIFFYPLPPNSCSWEPCIPGI